MAKKAAEPPTDLQVANMLAYLFSATFGGTSSGQYQLTRVQMRRLCEKEVLRDVVLKGITKQLKAQDLVLTDLGDHLTVVSAKPMAKLRMPTKGTLTAAIKHGMLPPTA